MAIGLVIKVISLEGKAYPLERTWGACNVSAYSNHNWENVSASSKHNWEKNGQV